MRAAAAVRELNDVRSLGLDPIELDLRAYWDDPDGLSAALAEHRMLWVRGGNSFVLRVAMSRAGADAVLSDLLGCDALVCASYSAACCVLEPSLRGA